MGIITEIKIPNIGEDEVEVTEILVKKGDLIEIEQSIIIVEGEKASIEIPSPTVGKIQEIKIQVGDKVKTGSVIAIVQQIHSSYKEEKSEKNSDKYKFSFQTEKNNNSIKNEKTKSVSPKDKEILVHAGPTARRMANEFSINLKKIKGTGRNNRILKEDIKEYIKNIIKNYEIIDEKNSDYSFTFLKNYDQSKSNFDQFGKTETLELSRIKKISGMNLHKNWVTIPHVTQFDEADITDLEIFRKKQNVKLEKEKKLTKITILIFIIKAVSQALEKYPIFNSSISSDFTILKIKKYINIGIAVNTANGLVVPVLKDIKSKGIIELSQELSKLSERARLGKLIPSEMKGGCFTISNLGKLGGKGFTPIVNAPEAAILGLSKAFIKPIWNGKKFIPKLILPLSLSYNHRIIDGVEGGLFMEYIKKIMSDLRLLIL